MIAAFPQTAGRRLPALAVAALLTLTVATLGRATGPAHGQAAAIAGSQASPTAVEETVLAVVAEREIRLPDERILALSPDGVSLAVTRERDSFLCVYAVAALDASPVCADLAAAGIRPLYLESVVWSPDGSRIALTEDGYRSLTDSDVWLLDAATGALTNLTDDGFAGQVNDYFIGADDASPESTPLPDFGVDAYPAWSPDGAEIAFARTTADRETALYRVPAAGGEPRLVATVRTDEPFAVYGGLVWAAVPDGRTARLIYAVALRDEIDPANGIWSVEATGGTPAQAASLNDLELDRAFLAPTSPRGDRALVFFGVGLQAAFRDSAWATVDLATGAVERLRLPGPSPDEPFLPSLATFSPDGEAILVGARSYRFSEFRLALLPAAGGEASVLREDLGPFRPTAEARGLFWATNDTVYVPTAFDGGLLLTLGPAPARPRGAVDPASVAAGTTLVVNEDGVALRAGPSPEAEVVAELALGTEVVALGPVEEVDGFAWVPVRDPASGTIGYVRVEFLSPSPEP